MKALKSSSDQEETEKTSKTCTGLLKFFVFFAFNLIFTRHFDFLFSWIPGFTFFRTVLLAIVSIPGFRINDLVYDDVIVPVLNKLIHSNALPSFQEFCLAIPLYIVLFIFPVVMHPKAEIAIPYIVVNAKDVPKVLLSNEFPSSDSLTLPPEAVSDILDSDNLDSDNGCHYEVAEAQYECIDVLLEDTSRRLSNFFSTHHVHEATLEAEGIPLPDTNKDFIWEDIPLAETPRDRNSLLVVNTNILSPAVRQPANRDPLISDPVVNEFPQDEREWQCPDFSLSESMQSGGKSAESSLGRVTVTGRATSGSTSTSTDDGVSQCQISLYFGSIINIHFLSLDFVFFSLPSF